MGPPRAARVPPHLPPPHTPPPRKTHLGHWRQFGVAFHKLYTPQEGPRPLAALWFGAPFARRCQCARCPDNAGIWRGGGLAWCHGAVHASAHHACVLTWTVPGTPRRPNPNRAVDVGIHTFGEDPRLGAWFGAARGRRRATQPRAVCMHASVRRIAVLVGASPAPSPRLLLLPPPQVSAALAPCRAGEPGCALLPGVCAWVCQSVAKHDNVHVPFYWPCCLLLLAMPVHVPCAAPVVLAAHEPPDVWAASRPPHRPCRLFNCSWEGWWCVGRRQRRALVVAPVPVTLF